MKINLLALLISAICFTSSCSSDDDDVVPQWHTVTIEAGWQNSDDDTRTQIGSDTINCWVVGNKVSVFTSTTGANREFTVSTIKDGGSSCSLSGQLQGEETIVAALYPFQADATYSTEGNITATFPSNQTATAGSFDPQAALATATYSAEKLTFNNATSLISFQVPSSLTNLDYVVLCGRGGEAVSGRLSIVDSLGKINYPEKAEIGQMNVVLKGNSSMSAGSTYYLTTVPYNFSTGISLAFVKSDGSYALLRAKTLDLSKGKNLQLTNLTQSLVFKTLITVNNREWAPEDLTLANAVNVKKGYFAWGETIEKVVYCGPTATQGEYVNNYRSWDNNAISEGNYTLSATEDAATVILGPYWRMPTKAEFEDAVKSSSFSDLKLGETNGSYNFGYYSIDNLQDNQSSYYWTREQDGKNEVNEPNGKAFGINSEVRVTIKKPGHCGLRIRPILNKQ